MEMEVDAVSTGRRRSVRLAKRVAQRRGIQRGEVRGQEQLIEQTQQYAGAVNGLLLWHKGVGHQ